MHQIFFDHAPQILPVMMNDRELIINIVLAIITFFAVLVALLQEPIKKLLNKAKVRIEIRKNPPDCHQILLTNQQTGQPVGYTLYCRFRITNENKINSAHNVEVFISHFWNIDKEGNKKKSKHFYP